MVAIVAMGTVSAFELSNFLPIDLGSPGSSADQNVTIDGVTFHIPGGYKENSSFAVNGDVEDYSSFKTTTYERGYMDGSKFINIMVIEYEGIEPDENLINFMDGSSKNINGVSGYLYNDGIAYTFTYAIGNKVISVQTTDENIIGDIIA